MIVLAHSLGLKVMLQPVVLANDGVWNGLFDPDDKGAWFNNYRTFLADYARLAQQTGVDLFCIGTEFFTLTTPQYSQQWRDTVASVRARLLRPADLLGQLGRQEDPRIRDD